MKLRIGIIGGSGLNNSDIFKNPTVAPEQETTCGEASSPVLLGQIDGVDCAILFRHGKEHTIMPSNINFRANIESLKNVGCTHIIASAACGSLKEEYKPGDFVIIDQFIDRTYKREQTFYDGNSKKYTGILHLPMGNPFCTRTREVLKKCARTVCGSIHETGTIVTVEGPRFSTKAESKMHQILGAHLVGMTTVPEVILAKELGMCYASLAIVTDYDCWKESEEAVTVEMVTAEFKRSTEKAIEVIRMTAREIAKENWDETITSLQESVKNNIMLPA